MIANRCSYTDIIKARSDLYQQYPNVRDDDIFIDQDLTLQAYALRFTVEVENLNYHSLNEQYLKDTTAYNVWCAEQAAVRRRQHEAQMARKEFKQASSQERKSKKELQVYLRKCLNAGNDIIIVDGKAYKLTDKL